MPDARLMPENYKARAEQAVLFTISAWDSNCPQHIPQRFAAEEVAKLLAERDRRIEMLEAEVRTRAGGTFSREAISTSKATRG